MVVAHTRLQAIYHIRCDARAIEARARAVAVEQSVEMPVAAITDDFVRGEIVGRVEAIAEKQPGLFEVRIALATETVGDDAGQLINMLFGNTSLHEDVVWHDLELPRRQIAMAKQAGVDTVMVAPMIMGLANFHRLVRDNPALAFIAHPSMAGAARIAPPLLIGKLFRVLGADAVVFPNHGGRFGYSPDTCRAVARETRDERDGLRPALPVPAGGMTVARVAEM